MVYLMKPMKQLKKIQVKPETPESHTGGNITHTPCI